MRNTFTLFIALCCMALCARAQEQVQERAQESGPQGETTKTYKDKRPYKSWVRLAPKFEDSFFTTEEALRIADNVLLYQHHTGGWPKNVYMPAELSRKERRKVRKQKDDANNSTIDNGATATEIRFLARTYTAQSNGKLTATEQLSAYKKAVEDGIRYILKSQYDNGGFPQFYPRPKGYYTHITYNDNAMVNIMQLLREVYEGKAPYTFIPDSLQTRAKRAFDKGIDCILKTQVKQNGKLTVWCAQHDEHTLAPAQARAYELPSLSGAESDNIVLLLMSLPNPSSEIIAAVEGAIEWFKENKITGIHAEHFTNDEGKDDYRMAPCPQDDNPCPPLWARFYTLEDNRPFFCDRDGIKRFDLSEIGYERRNGYSWYNDEGNEVIRKYEKWKKKNNL